MGLLRGCTVALCFFPALVSAQVSPIVVTEEAATVGRAASPFGGISDALGLPDGRVIIADNVTPALWIWTPESGEVRRFAREGEGPGEVENPVQLAERPDGGIAVYDLGHHGVLQFSAALEFEQTVRIRGALPYNPKDFAVLADKSFVIAGGRISNPTHLQRYDPSGLPLGVWGETSEGITRASTASQSAGGALRVTPDGWFFAPSAPYRVVGFSTPGFEDPTVVTEDFALIPEPSDESLSQSEGRFVIFRWYFDQTTGLFELPEGRLLTTATRFYSGDSVWSVHGTDGSLSHRSTVDRAYTGHDQLDATTFIGSYRDPLTDEHIAVLLKVEITE